MPEKRMTFEMIFDHANLEDSEFKDDKFEYH